MKPATKPHLLLSTYWVICMKLWQRGNFFRQKLSGKCDVYIFIKTFSKHFIKFRSWLESWCWPAKRFISEGFQHNDPISLASRPTKTFGRSPLQQPEHAKLTNSATHSHKFHAKVNFSANVTFIARYIK